MLYLFCFADIDYANSFCLYMLYLFCFADINSACRVHAIILHAIISLMMGPFLIIWPGITVVKLVHAKSQKTMVDHNDK